MTILSDGAGAAGAFARAEALCAEPDAVAGAAADGVPVFGGDALLAASDFGSELDAVAYVEAGAGPGLVPEVAVADELDAAAAPRSLSGFTLISVAFKSIVANGRFGAAPALGGSPADGFLG